MVYECPEEDRMPNINVEDIGDKKKVTDTMINTIRCALAYLEDETITLGDMTDPEVGKRFSPPLADMELSRGIVLDGKRYKFNSATSDGYTETLLTKDRLDIELTTALWTKENDGIVKMHPQYVTKNVLNPTCQGPWGAYSLNQYWYVGYNKYKPYHLTQFQIAHPEDTDATWDTSVCRAQTFTAAETGYIVRVNMKIHGTKRAQCPIYCELRSVDANGYPSTTVLGQVAFNFKNVSKGGMIGFEFKYPIPVTGGTTYAIVLRAPLTTYDNHYGVGGWSKNCSPDPCAGGYAFLSEDNGHTWIKYGKTDTKVPYGEGNIAPMDFAYAIHYHIVNTVYNTTTPEYVYFKPYKTNEITKVTIFTDGVYGPSQEVPEGTSVIWEVSTDFRTWYPVNPDNAWTKTFTSPYSRYLWVRAKLSTTDPGKTPIIKKFGVILETLPSKDSYLRTHFYNPETGVILGASCWSRIDAPVTVEPNTNVLVDVIHNTSVTKYFNTNGVLTEFTLPMLPSEPMIYVVGYVDSTDDYNEYKEYKDFTIDYDTGKVTFFAAPATGYVKFVYNPCWIRGLDVADFPLKLDLFIDKKNTVDGAVDYYLRTYPVDPLREVWLDDDLLEEEIDYTCNPQYRKLTLTTDPGDGHVLTVKYTPNLPDSGLALGYRMTRSNTTNQAYIEPNRFIYRV